MVQVLQHSSNGVLVEQEIPAVHDLLMHRTLILASNRGPVTLRRNESGELQFHRGSGGLVTALAGLMQHAEARWVACARTSDDA